MLLQKLNKKLAKNTTLSDETQELLNKVKVSNKNKLAKRLATLALAGAMVLAPLGLAACSANCQGIVVPNNQTQATPGGNTNGGNTNPGGNTNSNDDKGLELSDITKKLMTDDYYLNIAHTILYDSTKTEKNMLPVPYKFLKQHGHDVDAYLDGTLNAFASSYIYDNDKNHIYVSVKAENVSYHEYGNYYTNYVLKYPLTNQEYDEYVYLNKGGYVQGLLFIQELDNQKTPEIVNEINIAVSSYDDMIEDYTLSKNVNLNNYHKVEIDVFTVNKNEIEISVRNSSTANSESNKIGFIKMSPTVTARIETYDNNVNRVGFPERVDYNHQDEYQSSLQNITSFSYGYNIINASPYPENYLIK